MRRSVPATSSAVLGERIAVPPRGATASGPIMGAKRVVRANGISRSAVVEMLYNSVNHVCGLVAGKVQTYQPVG